MNKIIVFVRIFKENSIFLFDLRVQHSRFSVKITKIDAEKKQRIGISFNSTNYKITGLLVI